MLLDNTIIMSDVTFMRTTEHREGSFTQEVRVSHVETGPGVIENAGKKGFVVLGVRFFLCDNGLDCRNQLM